MQHKKALRTGIAVQNRIADYIKPVIIAFLFLVSMGVNAQTKPISLTAKNTPIKTVLAEIQQKSGYRILYNDEVVPDELRVSVNAENVAVKEILNTILKNTDLTFIMNNDELIIITKRQYVSQSNEVFGTVTDENGTPVPYANVVLLQPGDTTRLGYGAVTDEQGYYRLANVKPANYRLRVSFIGYKTQYAEFVVADDNQQPIVRNFTLPTDQTVLQELVVQGERPVLKAENGKLIYHLPSLLRSKSVTNAYDALKEIPGVMEQDERLTLIGTSGMTVLLNGKKTSMTVDQLTSMLKSIPLSRVEDVEIMYSAPPQYNIRGAAINVVLKQQDDDAENVWQGEVAGEFRNRYYPGGEGRASVVYLGKRTMVDALYSYLNGRSLNKEILTAAHTLNGTVYDINQESGGVNKYQLHNARLALQHTFANKDKADISYTGMFDDARNDRTASTNLAGTITDTRTDRSAKSSTHNIKADYSAHFGLNIGADYTLYNNKSDYFVENTGQTSSALAEKLAYQSTQQIHRTVLYANQSHTLKNSWSVNYGVNYSGAHTQNRSDVQENGASFEDASFDTQQREHIWNFFAGFSKSFSEKLSVQASLAAEYYNATETSKGKTNELWNDVAWFPTLNASYNASANHIFQLAVSSNKTYPSYWDLTPRTYYVSSYGVIFGNPYLRPSRDYGIGLTYIYKQKYIVRPFLNYIPNYSAQLPFQSPDKLQQKIMEQNYTYRQNMGVMGVVPFTMGKSISSRFIANLMYWHEKDDEFFDISFDRKAFVAIFQMNHDITLSAKPDVRMNVSGYVSTPGAIQGIYDLGASGNLSSALTWTFDKARARLILKADDIFDTRTPRAFINYKGQKSMLKAYRYTRTFSLSFVYRFGGYKEKERKEVDTSRFGTN